MDVIRESKEKYKKKFPDGTPIVVMCEKGCLEYLKLFVACHDVEDTGITVKQLLEEVGKDSYGNEYNTLMAAAKFEKHEVLVQLLEWGVDPSITDRDGWNALHISANWNKSWGCTESLLKKMPLESINKKNTWGDTPLDYAYYNGSPIKNDLVQLIRQHGGKANWYDRNGKRVGEGKGDLNDNNNVGSASSGSSRNNIGEQRKLPVNMSKMEQLAFIFGVSLNNLCECIKQKKITDNVQNSLEEIFSKNNKLKFEKWILNEWGTCEDVRNKVRNEGSGYFYNSYTNVPCDWNMYMSMVNGACYCGECPSTESTDEDE